MHQLELGIDSLDRVRPELQTERRIDSAGEVGDCGRGLGRVAALRAPAG